MPEHNPILSSAVSRIVPEKLLKFAITASNNQHFQRDMFSVNFAYGNREILLKYTGLDYSNQILGILEHGASGYWTDLDFRTPRLVNGKRSKYWAWSYETELLARSSGFSHVKAIGAPWYYLKKNIIMKSSEKTSPLNRILIMPSHSTGNAIDTAGSSAKLERAKLFKKIAGNVPATVILHAVDFCDPETFHAFRDVGFEVTCIGNSFQQPLWSSAGNRVRMMLTLYELMLSHTHYLSDGYGTSLHYAIDMGLSIGLFPKIKEYQILGNDLLGSRAYFKELDIRESNYLQMHVPNLVDTFGDSREYLQFSRDKLGADCVKDPEELLDLLDYRPNVYPCDTGAEPW
jgi:hypothetical protein